MDLTFPTTDEAQDLIPARYVNEFVYCPRLCYIEWIEGDFADNQHTVEGRSAHTVVDQPGKSVPLADEAPPVEEVVHTRSVLMSSSTKRLICKIDLVEGQGGCAIPVDYKKGEVPDRPEGYWEPDAAQLCAQTLILEDNGLTVPHAVLYYAGSKKRVEVAITPELRQRTLEAVAGMRAMRDTGVLPPPLKGSRKCDGCSLAPICLPDEVVLLQEMAWLEQQKNHQSPKQPSNPEDRQDMEESVAESYRDRVRRLYPPRDDQMPLHVQYNGAYLGKSDENLVVTVKGEKVAESHLFNTSQVCLYGAVQMSQQAVKECLARDIPICHFSHGGYFMGMTSGLCHKNVHLRLAQYRTHLDAQASLKIMNRIIGGKIRNQRTMLRRNGGEGLDPVMLELKNLAQKAEHAECWEQLMGIEGTAAAVYFTHFAQMLKPKPENELTFRFDERNRRPPADPVNALLSLAYSMLAKECFVTLWSVGFDPHLGFFHRPKYGKPSLALDVMEEFRPLIADSTVITAINTGVLSRKDFRHAAGGVNLTVEGRKKFIQAFERRMDTLVTHALFDYKLSYRRLINLQVRILSRVVSGEFGTEFDYPVFVTR